MINNTTSDERRMRTGEGETSWENVRRRGGLGFGALSSLRVKEVSILALTILHITDLARNQTMEILLETMSLWVGAALTLRR
jgi:hypothetical protein